jgi:MFS-type transporter involved in bile tolerance (Atg22 family)
VIWLGEWATLMGLLASAMAGYLVWALEPRPLLIVFAMAAAVGFCSSAFRVVANAALMRLVPSAVMGRASATFGVSTTLLQVAAALVVGPLIDAGGARAGFLLLAALITAGLMALVAALPMLRRVAEPA